MEVVAAPCLTCGAMIAASMTANHDEWHQRIAEVAIQDTERIDALTEIVRVLTRNDHGC